MPDTFRPPTIDSVSVGEGDKVLKSFSVRIVADESLDAATVTQATFELLDPSGNEVTPQDIQLRRNDQVVQLDYQSLSPGDYELMIHSGLVTDRAGNPLADDVFRHFTVTIATTKWISPSGGDWSNPSNWFNHVVPGPTDDVLIDVPGSTVTITHSGGNDAVHSLNSSEALVLSGGTLTVTTNLDLASTLTLSGGTLAHATVIGPVGSTIEVQGDSTLDGASLGVDLDVLAYQVLRVANGLVLDGTATLAYQARLVFLEGVAQQLVGTGTVAFASGTPSDPGPAHLNVEGTTTLTIGPGITLRAPMA